MKLISNISTMFLNQDSNIQNIENNTLLLYQFKDVQELLFFNNALMLYNIIYVYYPSNNSLTNKLCEAAIELCKKYNKKYIISESAEDLQKYMPDLQIENLDEYFDRLYLGIIKASGSYKTYFRAVGLQISKNIQTVEFINNYFDKIYVLNMQKRPDRWVRTTNLLEENHIYNVERFIGFDGNESDHKNEWEAYKKKPLSQDERLIKQKGIKSAGSWAILKSMRNLILDAKSKGYNRILTLQDDVFFHKQFIDKLQQSLSLILSWKLLYLGASQHGWNNININSSKGFYKCFGTTDGAFAVAIDCSVYDLILSEINKFVLPFDTGALCSVQKKFADECYVLSPNLIIADVRDSNLRKSRDLNHTGLIFKWDLDMYNILPKLS